MAQALRARRNDVSLFYPSSVYVSERPRSMVEYAMAKAAGETLCSEMNLAWAPLHITVDRLPRLPTDQTASVIKTDLPSPVACLLPVIREAQSWPRGEARRYFRLTSDPKIERGDEHVDARPGLKPRRDRRGTGWVGPRPSTAKGSEGPGQVPF